MHINEKKKNTKRNKIYLMAQQGGSISRKPIFSYLKKNQNINMIIMFSDGKQVLFLKEMLPFLGQSIKILLEGHI